MKLSTQNQISSIQYHDHDGDHGQDMIVDYDHDDSHGYPTKLYVHFDINDHGRDDDHNQTLMVSKD